MKLPVASDKETRVALQALVRANWRETTKMLSLQLLATVTAVLLPWLTGVALNWIAAGTTQNVIIWVIAAMLGLVLLRIVVTFFADYSAGVLGEKIFQQLRDRVIKQVMNLPLSVVEQAGSGDLLGRVTYDVRRVQGFVTAGASSIVGTFLMLGVTYIAALLTIPEVGWAVILPAIPIYFLLRWFFRRAAPLIQAHSGLVAQMSGEVSENAQSAQTVEAQNLVSLRRDRIFNTVRSSWNLQLAVGFTRFKTSGSLNALLMLPLPLGVLLGAYMIPRGMTTIGAITTLTMYTLQLRAPFTSAMYWVTNAQVSWASLRRITGVGLVPPDRTYSQNLPRGRTLRLRDVSFSYHEGAPVLHRINLTVEPGEVLAVVGTSGAGKSTMARLIAGIDGPTAGSVTIGGAPVVQMPEEVLHSQVALVTQEHHVFEATLRENLLLADSTASDAQMRQALADVEAHWVAELPDGLDTKLGATGRVLTSAQAQQLALARLVLMDPHTLVLDEATSMMDPTNAHQAERALSTVLEGRTVIMIAHRLFTAQSADRICVMEDGRIAELGTHSELLEGGGLYAKLWHAWQGTKAE